MGVNNSSLLLPLSNYIGRKRRSSATDMEQTIPSCKKFCPEDTIYEQCFVNGVGHDIVVRILDRKWKLHKESLIKSPYFASMFSGSWNESNKQEIEIQIPNPTITKKSIHIVLGSLYQPNISFDHEDIFSVIAAATLFQLDDLVTRCEDILIKSISCENVLLYYEVAKQYSLNKVLKGTLSFLLINLVLFYPSKPEHLRSIDCDLMQHLISSPKLVTSSSINIYHLLRLWLYLKTLPQSVNLNGITTDDLATSARRFFLDKPKSQCYLHTCQGAQYSRVFHCLELFPLISSQGSIVEIQEDNIVPQSWITSLYEKVVPIAASIMHPVVLRNQCPAHSPPASAIENFAVNIREAHLSRHCVKWSTVLKRDDICTPKNRSSWLTWTLHSYGLVTDWKFTGSNLKVMFTPSPLFEGNLLGDNDIKYVPLYCRFTIDCLGSNHQQLSCISKSTTKLLEKFRHEDLFSFRREDFGGESVSMYILSLQVFVVHRVILYKLMKEKLCDEFETPCIPHESVSNPPPPHNSNNIEHNNINDDSSTDSNSDVDIEGEDSSDSRSENSDSSDLSDEQHSSQSSDSEPDRAEPESPEPFPSPPLYPSPPGGDSSCLSSSLLCSYGEKWMEGKLAGGGEARDEIDEEAVVRIVLPRNIHTDTVY